MSAPDAAPEAVPATNMLSFLRLVGKLKTTKRTGWVYRQINQPESIADHMYRMSLITFNLPHENRDHLIKLSLAHDLAECIVGDITPQDPVTKQEKHRREEAAMAHIRDTVLERSPAGIELYHLWREYDDGNTDAACLVKEVDKFEMILQADEYEREQGVELGEFFESTRDAFKSAPMKALDTELRKSRDERLAAMNTVQANLPPVTF